MHILSPTLSHGDFYLKDLRNDTDVPISVKMGKVGLFLNLHYDKHFSNMCVIFGEERRNVKKLITEQTEILPDTILSQ